MARRRIPVACSKSLTLMGFIMEEESTGAGMDRGLGRARTAATSDRALAEPRNEWQRMLADLMSEWWMLLE